jgi:hypothetical protein
MGEIRERTLVCKSTQMQIHRIRNGGLSLTTFNEQNI